MVEFYDFDLRSELKKPSTKTCGYINFAMKPDGTWVKIPIMLAVGAKDGAVVLADACCHGDECEGTEGIIAAFNSLDVNTMSGVFIGIPALNLEAFGEMRRYGGRDFVPQDMNRAYPGNPEGFLTFSLAHYYFNNVVKHADAAITIHGGGSTLYLEPVTCFPSMNDPVSSKSEEMAKAFGFEALWRDKECDGKSGIQDHHSYLAGIPSITPEIGGQATRLHQREENAEKVKNGIINVLRLWKVIDEPVVKFDNQYYVELKYIYTHHGGIHKPQKKEGEFVKKGDVLSIITDVFGNEVGRVVSEYDAVVIGFLVYPVANPKSWVYLLGANVEGKK